MAAKIAALLITLIVLVAVGVAILIGMVVAMNGYSESDATWGFGVYIILTLIVSILMAVGAFFVVGFLTRKQYGSVISTLIAIPVFSIVGVGLEFVCSLIGVGVAEFVRVKF